MFGRVVFVATLCVAAALLGSFSLLARFPEAATVAAAPAGAAQDIPSPQPEKRQTSGYREALLEADGRGQYATDALVNGTSVRMLVDTGASDVVVSAATAARLGLQIAKGPARAVQTANGRSRAWPTLLTHVSFGGLYLSDVEALVLAPEAGEVNLLGESFLRRLLSVEQRDGMLILRQ